MNAKVFETIFIILCVILVSISVCIGLPETSTKDNTGYSIIQPQISSGIMKSKSGEETVITIKSGGDNVVKGGLNRPTTSSITKNADNKIQSTKLMSWTELSTVKVFVKGFPEDSMATRIATYQYKISSGDIDFMATMKAENGGYNMFQQSNVYKNGKREESYGLCQMMRKYHKEVNTKIFWESWQYQVELCYQKYKSGTKFYGFNNRLRYKNDFIINFN